VFSSKKIEIINLFEHNYQPVSLLGFKRNQPLYHSKHQASYQIETMANTNEEQPQEQECRSTKWFATMTFYVIALTSFVTHIDQVAGSPTYILWATSALSISMALAVLAVMANTVVGSKFVGTAIEGGLVSSKIVLGLVLSDIAVSRVKPASVREPSPNFLYAYHLPLRFLHHLFSP